MKTKAFKFYYTEDDETDKKGHPLIHIGNHWSTTAASLCGHVDRNDLGEQVEVDCKMPTCECCLQVWDMVKNGKLK
jgi:hypothetical protein